MDKKVLAGVGIGGAIALVVGGNAIASHFAAKELDQAIADVSDVVDIKYEKVNHSLLGRSTTASDVTITPVGGEPIKVDEVVLYDFKQEEDIPTYMNFAVNGVSISEGALGQENATMFAELGYEGDLSANFATEYEYEADDKTVRLKRFSMGADDVGDVEMSFQLANVTLDEQAIATMPFSLFGMEFISAEITYNDDSFVERLFETTAAAEGVSVDEVKADAIEGLKADLDTGAAPLPEEFIEEMTDFINDPDKFTITFSPDAPVPFSSFLEMGSPEEIIDQLNVRFES